MRTQDEPREQQGGDDRRAQAEHGVRAGVRGGLLERVVGAGAGADDVGEQLARGGELVGVDAGAPAGALQPRADGGVEPGADALGLDPHGWGRVGHLLDLQRECLQGVGELVLGEGGVTLVDR